MKRRIERSGRLTSLLFLLALFCVASIGHVNSTNSSSSNSTAGNETAAAVVPAHLFAGAPVDISTVNITVTQSGAAILSQDMPGAGYGVHFALEIRSPAYLQWNRATVQFAKSLFFSAPNAASSVFAPSRMLETASWTADVTGINSTLLNVVLHVGVCIDPPRRPTSSGDSVLQLAVLVPSSATNPPLSANLNVRPAATGGSSGGQLQLQLPGQVSSSVVLARQVIGIIFFLLIFLVIAAIFFQQDGGGSGALELLWTVQTMLAVTASPCARHSFYSFSTFVFWMQRVAIDARSAVPAIVHTLVILLGIAVSLLLASKSKSPQAVLRHPRLGLFFVTVFLLGGVQSSMLLTIGGVPDLEISTDAAGRAIGIVTLAVQLMAAIAFSWSGVGSEVLVGLRLERPLKDDGSGEEIEPSFWTDTIWRPVTTARRSSPIAGVFGPIAHLPRRLGPLANFLPFFLSLCVHTALVILLSIDPSNMGGCIATFTTCIAVHLLLAAYIGTGHSTCRSPAWSACLTLAHLGRAVWVGAALIHLDCNSGSVAAIDAAATVLSCVGLLCVLVAAVIALIAVKRELLLTVNKLKTSIGTASGASSPTSDEARRFPSGLDEPWSKKSSSNKNPLITVTSESHGSAAALRSSSPQDGSPSDPGTPVSGTPGKPGKGPRRNRGLPPLADGTGERPASPLSGGLHSSPTFASVMMSNSHLEKQKMMMMMNMNTSNGNNNHAAGGGNGVTASLGLGVNANGTTGADKLTLRNMQTAGIMLNSTAAGSRPRGISLESKLSSGSGGHEGPSGRKKSPTSSFGPTTVVCTRCGLPARPNPTGGQSICGACRNEFTASLTAGGADSWEISSPLSSSHVLHHNPHQTGGREGSARASPIASNVVLPSWEAQSDGRVHGIVQLPTVDNISGIRSSNGSHHTAQQRAPVPAQSSQLRQMELLDADEMDFL